MAKRFLTPLNLPNLASNPQEGAEGDLYFNTVDSVIKIYIDNDWVDLQGGGGSVIGGTNIDVDYNEELNTYTVNAGSNLETIESINNKFIHENHNNITAEYVEESGEIILSASASGGIGFLSASTIPVEEVSEGTLYYKTNQNGTKILETFVYLNNNWLSLGIVFTKVQIWSDATDYKWADLIDSKWAKIIAS